MEDILGSLTEAQRNILKQFRKNLEDILTPDHTDYLLVKFLRAKNFNLKESEKIFKHNFYNRITFGVNTLLDTYKKPEVIKLYETEGILGFAKDGSLIRYAAAGRLDFYGFIMSMSCYEICMYFSYIMEHDMKLLKEENQRTGKDVQEITYILDLEGFSIQQVLHKNVIEMGLDFTHLFQDCYPEIWRNILLVNVPTIFDKAFNLFRPVIRGLVFDKLRIADKDSTKDLLLKYIDEDVLPAFLGGKRVDSNGDPECREFITFAGKVPEKLYSRHQRIPLSPTDPDVRCVTIHPRSVYNISVAIYEAGTTVRTCERSEGGSLYVAVLYKEFGPDQNTIELPAEDEYLDETDKNCAYKRISVQLRGQFHCTQEDGLMSCSWPGIYVVRFSNAGNWFTSRKVLVKYEIIPPKHNEVS